MISGLEQEQTHFISSPDQECCWQWLCGSHLQSQSELYHVSWWYYTLVIDLIGQLRRDVIGRLSVKPWCYWLWRLVMSLVRFDTSQLQLNSPLIYCYSNCRLSSHSLVVESVDIELNQRRRRWQSERQKSNRFRFAKQQFCTCITPFCTFLYRRCTTTTWKCLFCRMTGTQDKNFHFLFLNFDTVL